MRPFRAALAGLLIALFSAISVHAEAPWINLFDGKTLDNWEVKGGKATYKIDGDAIVGTSAPNSDNTFLCTKKHFGDFILEFEFWGSAELNSGVQVRGNSLPDYQNGRVHGYQVELEETNRERDWSGGIYDEARRGWLDPKKGEEKSDYAIKFGETGKSSWKADDWNKVRVEAVGDHIQTWVNGVPRADLHDDMTPSGFIALQVHGVGDKTTPLFVKWRNIRLQEVKPAAK